MKVLALSALMLLSTSAFGFFFDGHSAHTLSGKGQWISMEGEKGIYSVSVQVAKEAKGEASITEKIEFGEGISKEFTYRFAKTKANFFAVYSGEEKIGDGYCFKMARENTKACHWEMATAGHQGEGSMQIDIGKHELHRMGSLKHADSKISWADHLIVTSFKE